MRPILTDDRQWLLGLGMLAADPHSGLRREDRRAALGLLHTSTVPPPWRQRIQDYLTHKQQRQAMYLETVDELVESLATSLRIFTPARRAHDPAAALAGNVLSVVDCPCRACWCQRMAQRIREAVTNEHALAMAHSTDTTVSHLPDPDPNGS